MLPKKNAVAAQKKHATHAKPKKNTKSTPKKVQTAHVKRPVGAQQARPGPAKKTHKNGLADPRAVKTRHRCEADDCEVDEMAGPILSRWSTAC